MPELAFDRMKADLGRAATIADALRPTLAQAKTLGGTAPDLLAALGLAAAQVALASRAGGAPAFIGAQMGQFITDAMRDLPGP